MCCRAAVRKHKQVVAQFKDFKWPNPNLMPRLHRAELVRLICGTVQVHPTWATARCLDESQDTTDVNGSLGSSK